MKTIPEAEALVAEVFSTIGAIQSGAEMRDFALFCSEHEVADFIELGTCVGGMFLLMDRACKPGLRISMDMPWERRDPPAKDGAKATFHELFPGAVEILGDIHAPEQRQRLAELLRDRKVDLIFQDSDHSAAGSMQDFLDYSLFVRPGGWFAFHDVRNDHGTRETYDELCKTRQSWLFVDPVSPFGIGVIQL